MGQYFRVTAYHKEINVSAIFDTNGFFDKIWQLSSYLIGKGFTILEVTKEENLIDINIDRIAYDKDHIYLRDCQTGKPTYLEDTINGQKRKVVQVNDLMYVP